MEKKEDCICKFVKEKIEMPTSCFDEYYFIVPENVIKPIAKRTETYKLGDLLPIRGESYEFPETFDIIDLHLDLVVKVREGRLFDVLPLEQYEYVGMPALNMKGFSIKMYSKNEFEELKKQYKAICFSKREEIAAFANTWMDIVKYRNIRYI